MMVMLLVKSLSINSNTYGKNPLSSKLGEEIVIQGTIMINELGLEGFTFKKLAKEISSTEASIYRYFNSKHMFLVFLSNLYWNWLEQMIRQLSYQQRSHTDRLEEAIMLLINPVKNDSNARFPFEALAEVIMAEGPKVYLTKVVDEENKEGVFKAYKNLCESIAQLILNINPTYEFAHSLASTAVETAHNQLFFSKHLPRLTDIGTNNKLKLKQFLFQTITSSISGGENN